MYLIVYYIYVYHQEPGILQFYTKGTWAEANHSYESLLKPTNKANTYQRIGIFKYGIFGWKLVDKEWSNSEISSGEWCELLDSLIGVL